ncbi:HD-GYP domain-containing protein [Streptomyces sp. SID3343]|uniref:HD-GYP domain-containing protein n=1 Tax=Streptomyces sp. SID3343 TaxID=2690260 RepID=UPI00136FA32A|nr:HD-GYP domain-containing protein [Streptomyces sp. SID3343]MYW00450.1 HD domain-containing protein [Streptomyces sp. SID3343]
MRTLPPLARVHVIVVAGASVPAMILLPWSGVDLDRLIALAALFVTFGAVARARLTGLCGAPDGALFPLVCASVLLLPAGAAATITVPGVLIARARTADPTARVVNAAHLVLSVAAASGVYELLGGPREVTAAAIWAGLARVGAVGVVLYLVSGVLDAAFATATQGVGQVQMLREVFVRTAGWRLGSAPIALMMAVLWQQRLGVFAAVLVLLPLYVAFWAYAQQARESAAHEATVRTFVRAVEIKDGYTRGHSERVARASVLIARQLGMREDRVVCLRYAGILHDVGKLSVSTKVLTKPGRLDPDELREMQRHPVSGAAMVRDLEFLGEAHAGILHHHERMDGRGYPAGLAGSQIPEFARVIAVADAFDSMTSTRSYRPARGAQAAMAELRRCSGSQFDPRMVDALGRALARYGWPEGEVQERVPAPRGEMRFDSHSVARERVGGGA